MTVFVDSGAVLSLEDHVALADLRRLQQQLLDVRASRPGGEGDGEARTIGIPEGYASSGPG